MTFWKKNIYLVILLFVLVDTVFSGQYFWAVFFGHSYMLANQYHEFCKDSPKFGAFIWPNLSCVRSYIGSRINFRTTFPKLFSPTRFQQRDFKFGFTWCLAEITLCLWSGFIYSRIRTFVEKKFTVSFPKRRLWNLEASLVRVSLLKWSWGQFLLQSKTFPTRLLGLLEKRVKIWRYGRSWNQVQSLSFGKVIQNCSCYWR